MKAIQRFKESLGSITGFLFRALCLMLVAIVTLSLGAPDAAAAVPAEITDLLADANTVWTGVKDILTAVVVFTVLLAFARRIRSR